MKHTNKDTPPITHIRCRDTDCIRVVSNGEKEVTIYFAVGLKYGNIYTKTRGSNLTSLPASCEVAIEPTLAASVVSELRSDESLKEDLRYLIGNETGKQVDVLTAITQLDELITQLEQIK